MSKPESRKVWTKQTKETLRDEIKALVSNPGPIPNKVIRLLDQAAFMLEEKECCSTSAEPVEVSIQYAPHFELELRIMQALDGVMQFYDQERKRDNCDAPITLDEQIRIVQWFANKYGGIQ